MIPLKDFTKLPNALVDEMDKIETLGEMKVLIYVARHTIGFGDDCKKITLDEFASGRKRADGTRLDGGTGLTIPTIRDGIARAVEHGFLVAEVNKKDSARVKYSYSLSERFLHPDCKELATGLQDSCNRTEKDTPERHSRKIPQKNTSEKNTPNGVQAETLDDWFPRDNAASPVVILGDSASNPPVDYAEAVVRFAERGGDSANWAVPPEAGGADDFADGPLTAFCALVGVNPGHLPDKKKRQWAKELRELGGEWRAGPGTVKRCIEALAESEFAWKTYSTPYADGFKADLGILIGRALGNGDPLLKKREPEIVVIGR